MNENDSLDMTIRIMDKLSEMKVLNKKQSADKDFAIQDAITQEIETVFNRISLKDQMDNNSISIGEFHNYINPYNEFVERITNCHLHNLEHYPEEKPTIDGAFKEVLLQYTEELYNEARKFMRVAK